MKITIKNHLSVINNLTFFICKPIFWCYTGVKVMVRLLIMYINLNIFFLGSNHGGDKYWGDGTSILSTQGLFIS